MNVREFNEIVAYMVKRDGESPKSITLNEYNYDSLCVDLGVECITNIGGIKIFKQLKQLELF